MIKHDQNNDYKVIQVSLEHFYPNTYLARFFLILTHRISPLAIRTCRKHCCYGHRQLNRCETLAHTQGCRANQNDSNVLKFFNIPQRQPLCYLRSRSWIIMGWIVLHRNEGMTARTVPRCFWFYDK